MRCDDGSVVHATTHDDDDRDDDDDDEDDDDDDDDDDNEDGNASREPRTICPRRTRAARRSFFIGRWVDEPRRVKRNS